MNRFVNAFALFLLVLALFSCQSQQKGKSVASDALVSHIDTSAVAGDDFFQYANGKWFAEHPISASEQSSGIWQIIQDTINSQVLKICTVSAKAGEGKGSNK